MFVNDRVTFSNLREFTILNTLHIFYSLKEAMEPKRNWIPLTLTLTVFPGMGHFYLKQKVRGTLFFGLAMVLAVGALARFMVVLFAVANLRRVPRPPLKGAWQLLADTLKLDWPILLTFLGALLLVWGLATLDILVQIRKRNPHES